MRKLILILLLISMTVSGRQVVTKLISYQQANQYYNNVQSEYVQPVTPSPTPTIKPVKRHGTKQRPPITIDFPALYTANTDVIGWLYSENTVINYPVMQTNNNVYYLRHLLDRSYSANGSIFLDATNNSKFQNDNSILYGHHMRDGSMFASIEKYKEQTYFDEHPRLWLLTPTKDYMLVPFAGLIVSPDRDSYFKSMFTNNKEKIDYFEYAIENSTFKGDVTPNEMDMIITLTTCDYTFKDARFILICILAPVI